MNDAEILADSNYMIQFVGTQPTGQIDSTIVAGTITLTSSVVEPVDLTYKILLFTANPVLLGQVKPSDLVATNSPVDGYVAKKNVATDEFIWEQDNTGSNTGIVNSFNIPYTDNTYKAVETITL